MKRFELFFTFLQLPLDYFLLVLAGFSAYSLRFTKFITAIRPVLFNITWQHYWPIVFWVALGWVIIFALSGLYSINPNRKFARDVTRIIMACSTGFAAITIFVFFTLQRFDSRFLVLAGWILGMVYVMFGRLLLRGVKSLLYRSGVGLRRVVVVGQDKITDILMTTLKTEPRLGYLVAGTFAHFNKDTAIALSGLNADEILFTDAKASPTEAIAAIEYANTNHITFKYTADFFATISSNMMMTTIAGVPIVELRRTRLNGWWRIFKRLFDIIVSALLMIIFSPIYLLLSLAVMIDSGRPVLYKNDRVGQFNKQFKTLKFRTMFLKDSTGAEYGGETALNKEAALIEKQNAKTGPIYKVKNDPRITPLGRWLRRWSLDELPQFWNVFVGEMSLVGPRPHQPREVANYGNEHSVVFALKPGITGLAQISGRSDLSFEDEMRLDAFYIENWNLYLDLIILIKTPFVVLAKRGSIV